MDKQLQKTLKIILIIGIALYGISILLPWGGYDYGRNGKLDLYIWGSHSINYNFFNQSGFVNDNWVVYILPPDFNSMLEGKDNPAIRGSWGIAFLILPFWITGIIIGMLAISYFKKMLSLIIVTEIFFIITIISLYIFTQFGVSSLFIHRNLGNIPYSLGVGFIFALVGIILLFIVYFMSYFMTTQKNEEGKMARCDNCGKFLFSYHEFGDGTKVCASCYKLQQKKINPIKLNYVSLVGVGLVFFIFGIIAIWYGNIEKHSFYYDVRQLGEITVLTGYIIMIIAISLIIIGFTFAVYQSTKIEDKNEDAKGILDKRYAKSELTKEEYRQMKKELEK
jgi:uncharacterized membrane protein